jgi:hypothetical protein
MHDTNYRDTNKGDKTLNIDDSKLPSDESLQNFTNGIDFSNSLFDTDRISNLDISGSSKSETEFTSYSYREENCLSTALELSSNEMDRTKKCYTEVSKDL